MMSRNFIFPRPPACSCNAIGPSNDFGLYHVDLDSDPDLARVPTESVDVYRELIAEATGADPRSLP